MIALEAQDLHTFYGKSHILHGVNLEVRGIAVTSKTRAPRYLFGFASSRDAVAAPGTV